MRIWLLLLILTVPAWAQLAPPTELRVERNDRRFRGRWQAVKGASFYEVWIERFGRWSFNPKTLETSPFTSSFEVGVEDERSRFKVRAVDADGNKGEFSAAVRARKAAVTSSNSTTTTTQGGSTSKKPKDGFDPKAPPPEAPSGLFAIWVEPTTIKLVWRKVEGAKNYSVEELKDGKWISPPAIEFTKPNNALIKKHPAPGPYKFRVRSVGRNGRASKPSRPTKAKR